MRTTIRLDAKLLGEAKRVAVESGRTLTSVIEDALRAALAQRKLPSSTRRIKLKTHGSGGLLPGVDLDDSAGLLGLMEPPSATS